MKKKVYYSIEQIEKKFFPVLYKERQDEKLTEQCPKCNTGKLELISDSSHLVVYECNRCEYKREIIPPDV